jgi:hypothetical protein
VADSGSGESNATYKAFAGLDALLKKGAEK